MENAVLSATELIETLAPGRRPVPIRVPLDQDECVWFLRAVTDGIVSFGECPPTCFRLKKWGASGPDHFATPAGKPRHLFSKPVGDIAWLNREYIPHIAAYSLAVIRYGYDPNASSFSLYRTFSRDLIGKTHGQSYETDAEFYDDEGRIYLQIEAKASTIQTERLAAEIEKHGQLAQLPQSVAKEIEYVLDLKPAYLWVAGPGSVDPPRHVFAVAVNGKNATFSQASDLPKP
ncbi:hypothetical protein [Microtetraspora malaysiensis]|uniref:Protein NO VEIN C-terminal domain-containing protein n=1 Tax=Microtetraspora malaysiensis TaxID=161358 RepID=A0ABW6T6S8_9ACTN